VDLRFVVNLDDGGSFDANCTFKQSYDKYTIVLVHEAILLFSDNTKQYIFFSSTRRRSARFVFNSKGEKDDVRRKIELYLNPRIHVGMNECNNPIYTPRNQALNLVPTDENFILGPCQFFFIQTAEQTKKGAGAPTSSASLAATGSSTCHARVPY
jgi:hypothetical protein